jgi:hypothetical protein
MKIRPLTSPFVQLLFVLALLGFLVAWPRATFAQPQPDWHSRFNISVDWKPLKKLTVDARYRLQLDENSSRFRRSMFSAGLTYDPLKWLRVGVEYRYATTYASDKQRLVAFVRFDKGFKDLSFRYRLQYQQQQDYLFEYAYLADNQPRRVFRNRLAVDYSFTRKFNVYVYAEHFARLRYARALSIEPGGTGLQAVQMRYGLGCGYTYKRRHSFGAECFLNQSLPYRPEQNRLVTDFSYTYHLTKKKKKSKAPTKPEEAKEP